MEEWFTLNHLLMLLAGLMAGVVNSLSGSGSIFTLSVLLFAGLPAGVANGTNRLGIICQSLISTSAFMKSGQLDLQRDWRYIIPTVLGAVAGAWVATDLSEEVMQWVVGFVMIGLLYMTLKGSLMGPQSGEEPSLYRNKFLSVLVLIGVGFYGGFIQVGIGLVMMVALIHAAHYTPLQANALKIFIILIYTFPAFAIFWYHNQIEWVAGTWLAVGQIAGSLWASRFAVRSSNVNLWINRLMVVMIVLTITRMFGLWDVVAGWLSA